MSSLSIYRQSSISLCLNSKVYRLLKHSYPSIAESRTAHIRIKTHKKDLGVAPRQQRKRHWIIFILFWIKHIKQIDKYLANKLLKEQEDPLVLSLKLQIPQQIKLSKIHPHFLIEKPLPVNYNNKEYDNNKMSYLHPQRKQIQNPNICDTLNIFFNNVDSKSCYNSTAYGSHRKEASQVFQHSLIKELSQNQFKNFAQNKSASGRKPTISNFTGSSQVEDSQAIIQGFAQDDEAVPVFARTCEERMYYNRHAINPFLEQSQRPSNERPSSKSLARSQQKKITLRQIQKSKETIKKVVYQLERSKSKCSKQKIKINGRNTSHEKKGQQVQSSYASPVRPKSVQNKSERHSIKQRCVYTIQQIQEEKDSMTDQLSEFQSVSKNLQMYYNYMKAKQANKKIQSCKKSNALKHKTIHQNSTTVRKVDTKNQDFIHLNPVVISKDSTKRSRKIDLKVDLNKTDKNTNTKLPNRKNNK